MKHQPILLVDVYIQRYQIESVEQTVDTCKRTMFYIVIIINLLEYSL